MAQFPFLPFWTDAYLGDTTHLSTIEHGAYLLLLITAWRSKDCQLPDDNKMLARYTKLSPSQWRRIRPILEPFFFVQNGIWEQGRLTDERNAVKRKSKSAKHSAEARWLKSNKTTNANASNPQCERNANHNHNHKEEKNNKDVILKETGKHEIPNGWKFNEKAISIAQSEGYTHEETIFLEGGFKDYWCGKRSRKTDIGWNSAGYNWLRGNISQDTINSRRHRMGKGQGSSTLLTAIGNVLEKVQQ
jgi:uncharacterized protein YdaU (DUF1376 family)